MTREPTPDHLYVCVHVAEFPAQSLLRLRPDLHAQPIVVMEGRPPQEVVCSINRHAFRLGAELGMTRLDAEAIPTLRLVARSAECEAAARSVLLECCAQFSPRIEEASYSTACVFVLDMEGTERLFGSPGKVAERLNTSLRTAGFHASIAMSANYHAARIKAAASRGVAIIHSGQEGAALAKLPLSFLGLSQDTHETFASWGIRMLGDLADLPEVELISRLGPEAQLWRALACGIHDHLFSPIEPELSLREFYSFEASIEQIDSLLFIGARMVDCLVGRAYERALCIAEIRVSMLLETGIVHSCLVRPAIPSQDRKFLLKLLQLEIAAHPPQAPVMALELSAEAGQSSTVQLGLFAPQTPEPSRLDVTLARLRALVGDDRVGTPLLEDSHRPAAFSMRAFALGSSKAAAVGEPRMALRRVRPPRPIHVFHREEKPVEFRMHDERYDVTAAYGPWKTSGCWWSVGEWDLEEWDILARCNHGASVACLLVHHRACNQWNLEAFYD